MYRKLYVLFVVVSLFFTACMHSTKSESTNTAVDKEVLYRQALTAEDSLSAKVLVISFMDAVKQGNYADAATKLYVLNAENPYKKPELLDNEGLEETIELMKKINLKSYEIKSMEFVTAVNNPAKCEILTILPENNKEVKLTWVLNPVNYMGKWLLCFTTK
jgi:hypothetical protein